MTDNMEHIMGTLAVLIVAQAPTRRRAGQELGSENPLLCPKYRTHSVAAAYKFLKRDASTALTTVVMAT